MKHLIKISWLLIAFALLTLAACGGGTSATPTADAAPVFTQIALTALALQTETALAASPTPTATNTPKAELTPKVTNEPLITDTPLPGTPSATPLVLKTPRATSQQACDNPDSNIIDVTIPDNTEISSGASFVKTWGFKNLGPCTWNQDYVLIFSYGSATEDTKWDKVKPVNFPDVIAPGDTMNISVNLTAPSDAGTYRGVFRLQNDKGFNFGPEFWVQIVVK